MAFFWGVVAPALGGPLLGWPGCCDPGGRTTRTMGSVWLGGVGDFFGGTFDVGWATVAGRTGLAFFGGVAFFALLGLLGLLILVW